MDSKLSYFSVSIFIAIGALVVFSLLIFAKRQITRFTIKSVRRPHLPTGHSAPPELQLEIKHWLERIEDIQFEPKLVHSKCGLIPSSIRDQGLTCNYKYRMLALDALSAIDKTVDKYNDPSLKRSSSARLRTYLLSLYLGPLSSEPIDFIRKFADSYDHARHMIEPFGQAEYQLFIENLQLIVSCLEADLKQKNCDAPNKSDTRVTLSRKSTEIITLPVRQSKRRRKPPLIAEPVVIPPDCELVDKKVPDTKKTPSTTEIR